MENEIININKIHYLDNASTTIINEEVLNAMYPYFNTLYFNASSKNVNARIIKKKIEQSRDFCAQLINCSSDEIIFTSGATEAINFALKGFFEENFEKGNHLITCKTEHKAILNTCAYLEEKGVDVTYLDVSKDGHISLNDLESEIKENTALIALMYVNNETGVIHDMKAITSVAKKHNIQVFCDATQAFGKLLIDVKAIEIDLLCMSAHKIEGPKGVGFLYKRNGIKLTPLIHGGSQENNMRGGTYNTPLIIGLGKACELCIEKLKSNQLVYQKLSSYFIKELENKCGVSIVAKNSSKVNSIFNLHIEQIEADLFISQNEDVYVSNGSACNSMIIESSHVLKAMGYTDKECKHCIRISLAPYNTIEDLDTILKFI